MTSPFAFDRRSPRKPVNAPVRLERRDGSVIDGTCVDASDEGFGIAVAITLKVGEILRITVGTDDAPSFIARVVWQHASRIGLYCVGSKPIQPSLFLHRPRQSSVTPALDSEKRQPA